MPVSAPETWEPSCISTRDDAVDVEFVTAAGRTQALLTLRNADVRAVHDDDLLAVRVAPHKDAAQRALLRSSDLWMTSADASASMLTRLQQSWALDDTRA